MTGGRPPGTPFRCAITGETGALVPDGGALRAFQSGRLALSVGGVPVSVREGEVMVLSNAAVHVAAIYASLRDDIQRGTTDTTDFERAERLARLVDARVASSVQGTRATAAGWPGT